MIGNDSILVGIVSIILLIVFLFMAGNIGTIKRDIGQIKKVIIAYGKATGYGITYKCEKCQKTYEGKLAKCPHCGDEKVYDS